MTTRSTGYFSYFAATVAPRAAMFGLMIVLTRWFPLAEYGFFVLVITVGEILDAVLANWIRIFALRTESARGGLRPYRLGRVLALNAGATLIGAVLAGPIALATVPDRAGAFALALTAYLGGLALVRLALLILQIADRHRAYALVEGVRAVAVVATAILAADLRSGSFLPASLALSLTSGVIAATALVLALRDLSRPRFTRAGYRAAARFALPLMGVAVLAWVLTWFDRLVINHFLGAAAVGLYAAAYAIGRQPIELLVGPLNTYAFPRLVRAYEAEGAAGLARDQAGMLVSIAMLGAGGAAGLALLAEPLAALLLPAAYRAHVGAILPAVAVGAVLNVVRYAVFDNTLFVLHRNGLQLRAMAVTALAGVPLSVGLIAWLGIPGAGWSFVATAALACAASVLVGNTVLAFRWPVARLARIGVALAAAAAALIAVETWLGEAAPWLVVALAGGAFTIVYAGVLTLLRISVVGALIAPWAQGGERPAPGRPTVLQLISSLRVGGAERMLVSLMRTREDATVAYVVVVMNDEVDEALYAELVATGHVVHRLGRREGHLHPRYLLALWRIVRAHGVSVVHAHNEGSRLWAMLLKLVHPRLKVAYTLHNAGILPGYGTTARLVYRAGVDATVAISGAVHAESLGYGLPRLTAITNGIDLDAFPPAERRGEGGLVRLIQTARFMPEKGQDVLIDALAHLVAAGHDVHLTLAGPMPREDAFLAGLHRQVATHGLTERVSFVHGRTDVAALLAACDIYVLPSREEGFGLGLVEAMASGLPVVATATGGPREIVAHGTNGLLVPIEDAAAMAEALAHLIQDRPLADRLAAAGRARAAGFDIRAQRTGYATLYRELAGLHAVAHAA